MPQMVFLHRQRVHLCRRRRDCSSIPKPSRHIQTAQFVRGQTTSLFLEEGPFDQVIDYPEFFLLKSVLVNEHALLMWSLVSV